MQFPSVWHLCIAAGPLASYLLLLGIINLSRRPFITTGARDAAALGVAISGLMIVGPMQLFMPQAAAERFGGYVWLLLLTFYSLVMSLTVLLMRPRLVIYNIPREQLRAILAQVLSGLDPDVRWAGDSVALPRLGVRLTIESHGHNRSTQLVSAGPNQNFIGWRRLELALGQALRQVDTGRSLHGALLTGIGLALFTAIAVWLVNSPAEVAQGLDQLLRP